MEPLRPLPLLIEKIGETRKPTPGTSSLMNRLVQLVQPSLRVNQLRLSDPDPTAAAVENREGKLPAA